MALIDDALVMSLITTRLQVLGLAGPDLSPMFYMLFAGDQEPRAGGEATSEPITWARLVAIDLRRRPRTRGDDEPEHADVIVTINVFASREAVLATPTALARAMQRVVHNLAEQTLRDTGTTHQVDLRQAECTADAEPDEQRGIATGVVVIPGIASRQSGTSVASYG